ncbi:MAG: hypothetical protein Q9195_008546 [Heterodermia aff. obscurata]
MSSNPMILAQSDEAIEACYDKWLLKFVNKDYPLLDELDTFSPSWNNLWQSVWESYDALETLSKERHMAQRFWQVETDNYRHEFELSRQNESGPMTRFEWDRCPLGLRLEQLLDTKMEHRNREWGVALKRAARFERLIDEQPSFKACLSLPQQVSWTLLEEWWSAKYQDLSLSKAARASMKAAASSPAPPMRFYEWRSSRGVLQVERSSLIEKSLYHSTLFYLFLLEFHPGYWEPYMKDVYLDGLQRVRKLALAYASTQKLGYASYAALKGLSDVEATAYIGSNQEACPWLQSSSDDQGMPFFLWDVSNRRTEIVGDLDEKPVYWCVSHTWGRWRKAPAIQIDGVPWLVPQNDRFTVSDLPNHLEALQQRGGEPLFIWIDLFCIPQDRSAKADEEINRQALIFQNASRCLSWQNDVIDWSVTRDALTWLGLSFLQTTSVPGLYDLHQNLSEAYAKSQRCVELFPEKDAKNVIQDHITGLHQARNDYDIAYVDSLRQPATWFSSLWTLQEAMLCPDMYLVERNWTQLTDSSGSLIPLNAIFMFVDTVETIWNNGIAYRPYRGSVVDCSIDLRKSPPFNTKQYVKWPRAARQLRELGIVTRMRNLFDSPSPTTVLIAANLRECTGDRAPAIMSAIGVTDWYDSARAGVKDLVLNSYPLAFVREAASKLGATFYYSVAWDHKIPRRYQVFRGKYCGSMLPFSFDNAETRVVSRHFGVSSVPNNIIYEIDDHPAASSWRINVDGSVSIISAGILASSNISTGMNLKMCITIMSPKSEPQICSFQEWVSRLPKNRVVYAVSLLRDANFQHGIILQSVSKKTVFLLESVVRIDIFHTRTMDFPKTSFVNWLAI